MADQAHDLNHIWMHEEIEPENSAKIMELLQNAAEQVLWSCTHRGTMVFKDFPPLTLHINCPGGDLYSSLALHDFIANLPVPTKIIVEEIAASGATVVLQAGTVRQISPNSTLLVHDLSAWIGGKTDEIKDHMVSIEQASQILVGVYARKSKLSEKKIRKLMERESWLTAPEAVTLKLADSLSELRW